MKYAAGMKTCAKIYLFVYLQPSVNKNSQNLGILTLQFDDVIVKTIYKAGGALLSTHNILIICTYSSMI